MLLTDCANTGTAPWPTYRLQNVYCIRYILRFIFHPRSLLSLGLYYWRGVLRKPVALEKLCLDCPNVTLPVLGPSEGKWVEKSCLAPENIYSIEWTKPRVGILSITIHFIPSVSFFPSDTKAFIAIFFNKGAVIVDSSRKGGWHKSENGMWDSYAIISLVVYSLVTQCGKFAVMTIRLFVTT